MSERTLERDITFRYSGNGFDRLLESGKRGRNGKLPETYRAFLGMRRHLPQVWGFDTFYEYVLDFGCGAYPKLFRNAGDVIRTLYDIPENMPSAACVRAQARTDRVQRWEHRDIRDGGSVFDVVLLSKVLEYQENYDNIRSIMKILSMVMFRKSASSTKYVFFNVPKNGPAWLKEGELMKVFTEFGVNLYSSEPVRESKTQKVYLAARAGGHVTDTINYEL